MSNRKFKTLDPSQKKVPENPKYKNVMATIDTGASMSKYMRKIENLKQNYKFAKDEIFKRMKITTFVQLFVQVFRLSQDMQDCSDTNFGMEDIIERDENDEEYNESCIDALDLNENNFSRGKTESTRSTLLSVASGIGEMDVNKNTNQSEGNMNNNASSHIPIQSNNPAPYLLLDLRDKDEYDKYHIVTALSYPKAILSRSVNYESKEMLAYKNKEGFIILLYDEDERIAPTSVATLVQRGYDNIFMLSGGLKVAYKTFPESLITGVIASSITGSKTKIKTNNNNDTTTQIKLFPTVEDIDKIEIYLNNLIQSSNSSSRLSKFSMISSSRNGSLFNHTNRTLTAASNRSNISSRSNLTNDRRPCFKP